MNVVKLRCNNLHSDNTIFKLSFSPNCRRNILGQHTDFCPLQQHLPASFTNLLKLSSAARLLPRFLLGLACFLRLPLLSSVIITLYFVSNKLSRERCECVFVLSACLRMNGDEASPSVTAGDSDLDGTPSRGDEP